MKRLQKSPEDPTKLIYYKGQLYRNFPIDKLMSWEFLLDSGLPVEPILGVEENPSKELLNLVQPRQNEVIVKSGIVGKSVFELITRGNLSKYDCVRIAKQMVDIIINLWRLGYSHGHPHLGNFTVVFKRGYPKTYLIDFSQIALTCGRYNLNKDFYYLRDRALWTLINDPFYGLFERKLLTEVNKLFPHY